MKRITFRMVQVFEAAERHGSMKGAAIELGLSVPTVHEYMYNLQDLVGHRLFFTKRTLHITDAGRDFAKRAAPIVRLFVEMLEAYGGLEKTVRDGGPLAPSNGEDLGVHGP